MLFRNMIEASISGENIERFLNLCSFHGIVLYEAYRTKEEFHFKIRSRDFFSLKPMVRKSRVKLKIIKKQGAGFWLKKQKKRSFFWCVPFLSLLLLWLLSHFLWRIQIQGNVSVTKDVLRDFLQSEGIFYGMPLKDIPINRLKNDLRSQFDEVTWVSIYRKGTTLQISIKENDGTKKPEEKKEIREDLIAPENGIVESVLLREGTLLVTVGDEVKKGDSLILGRVQIPAEDGTIKKETYTKADGDIVLICEYPIRLTLLKKNTTKVYTGKEKHKLAVYGKEKNIEFPPVEIPFSSYDTITEDIKSVFVSFFALPVEIKKTTYRDYHIYEKIYSQKEGQDILKTKLDKIIESLEEKGVQIIEKNVKIVENTVQWNLVGTLKIKIKCNEYRTVEENP